MLAVATSIDEVIAQLGDVIERSLREQSRLGFFAALYRKVTIKVKEGIVAGRFDDGPRMERLDVTFANRYLGALERFRRGEPPTPCWLLSLLGRLVRRPIGKLINLGLLIIRSRETSDVSKVIEVLNEISTAGV